MYGYMHEYGGGFMWIFWLLLIVAIAWIIKTTTLDGSGPGKQKSALDILKERYARGEINQEEFEQKKQDLSN